MNTRTIRPARTPIDALFRAAASKSATHRALVLAALASGPSTLREPLDADDTRATREGLIALGVPIRTRSGGWIVTGCGGRVPGGGALFLGESGSSLRFLLAVAALGEKVSILDGGGRLRERPIEELARALVGLGGAIHPLDALPVQAGGKLPDGGTVRLPGGRSSQFASALLLVGAHLPAGLDLRLDRSAVSVPYVELTAETLRRFGVRVDRPEPLRWRVQPGAYAGIDVRVEGDHSSASYMLAAAAIVGGRVRVENLDPTSRQPDARLGDLLKGLGCAVRSGEEWIEVDGTGVVPGFDLDLADAPDLVPTMASIALFATGPCVLRGIGHLRLKESDRLEVLARNLRHLGRPARALADLLEIGPSTLPLRGGTITTASDHRIAMAFAVAGLRIPGVVVDDAGCVSKSNPLFWDDFRKLEGDS